MIDWLDAIGIRDPLWGTLGWLAIIVPLWLWFWSIYLAFGPLGPCGEAWREQEGWPWPGERFWRLMGDRQRKSPAGAGLVEKHG